MEPPRHPKKGATPYLVFLCTVNSVNRSSDARKCETNTFLSSSKTVLIMSFGGAFLYTKMPIEVLFLNYFFIYCFCQKWTFICYYKSILCQKLLQLCGIVWLCKQRSVRTVNIKLKSCKYYSFFKLLLAIFRLHTCLVSHGARDRKAIYSTYIVEK